MAENPEVKVFALDDAEVTEQEKPSNQWSQDVPIIIDFGAYEVRVGMATSNAPAHVFPNQAASYRDRKAGHTVVVAGNDVLLDNSAKQAVKTSFDGAFVTNWDTVEHVLDYCFNLLGVKSKGRVANPIILSEPLCTPRMPRETFIEMLFKCYNVPSVGLGVDALFSYRHNVGQKSGIIISFGYEATHIIPLVNGNPEFSSTKRLKWGGRAAAEYLQRLLVLKYPFFPTRVTISQAEELVKRHCYTALDYKQELEHILDVDVLASKERIIQAPLDNVAIEKTQEELEAMEQRRKESGQRLKERAARIKEEMRQQKELDLKSLLELRGRLEKNEEDMSDHEYSSLDQLDRVIRKLESSLTGVEIEEEEPVLPLINVPDEQLDPPSLKEKRRQKLLRAGYDARVRAKQEKRAAAEQAAAEAAKEAKWRETDLQGWIRVKRTELAALQQSARERRRLKQELSNRKSLASQLRMKSIAALASEGGSRKRRRKGEEGDDGFGANDDDWQVYLDAAQDDGDEEGEQEKIDALQQDLLEYDQEFTSADLVGERMDWRESVIHKFLYGAHPLDNNSHEQAHQLNLNVERVRVPEVFFQPNIAGIDQAGISEVVGGILARYGSDGLDMAQNVLVTGGFAKCPGLCERIHADLQSQLPVDTPISVRRASDPSLDAWKGMAEFAKDPVVFTKSDFDAHEAACFKKHLYSNAL